MTEEKTDEKTTEQKLNEIIFGDKPVQDQVSQEAIKNKEKVKIIKYSPKEPEKIGDGDGKGVIDFFLKEHPELEPTYGLKETPKKEAEKPKIKQETKKEIDDIVDRETGIVQEDTTQEATKKQEVIQEPKKEIKYKKLEIEHTNNSTDDVNETLKLLGKETEKRKYELKINHLVVKALVNELGRTYGLGIGEEEGGLERFKSFGKTAPDIRTYHINDSCDLIVGFDEDENRDVALKMLSYGNNAILDWIVLGYLKELDNVGDKGIERLYNELQDKESTEVLEPIRENVMKYVVTEYIREKIGKDSKITFDEIIERLAENKDKRQAVINEIRDDYEAISYFLENKLNENKIETKVVLEGVIKEARENPIEGEEGEININEMFDNIIAKNGVDEEILKRDMIGMKGKDKKLEESLGEYIKGIGNSVKDVIEGNKDAVSITYKIADAMESGRYNPKDIEGIIKEHKNDLTNKQIRFFYRILGKKKLIVNVGEEIDAIENDDMKIIGADYDDIKRALGGEYLLKNYHTVDLIISDKKEPEELKEIVRDYFKDVDINILLNKRLDKPKYDRKQ